MRRERLRDANPLRHIHEQEVGVGSWRCGRYPHSTYRRIGLAVSWITQYLVNYTSERKMAEEFSFQNRVIYSSATFKHHFCYFQYSEHFYY